jgi:hypothetical protein
MTDEQFYRECAAILGAEHVFRARRFAGRSRWNNRDPGNGRFPGYGTIRMFAPDQIHIALRTPEPLSRRCHSVQEALALLKELRARAGGESASADSADSR